MGFLHLVLIVLAADEFAVTDSGADFSAILGFPVPAITVLESGVLLESGDLGHRLVPGEPALPVRTVFVPVPFGAEPVLRSSVISRTGINLPSDLVRTPEIEGEGLDAREVAATPIPGPDSNVILRGVFPLAGTQVAVVDVFPATGARPSSWVEVIDISLTWNTTISPVSLPGDNPLSDLVGKGVPYWPHRGDGTAESMFWGKPWARFSIEETGAYIVTGANLENSSCSVTGSPISTLCMYTGPGIEFDPAPGTEHQLEEIAIQVDDIDGDGVFDPEDAVRFIGMALSRWNYAGNSQIERLFHRYSTHNVYWLTWGEQNGSRMNGIPSSPSGNPSWGSWMKHRLWLEEDHIWQPRYELRSGWTWMSTEVGGSMSVSAPMPDGANNSEFTISVITTGSSSNTVSFFLGGSLIHTEDWYGAGTHQIQFDAGSIPMQNTLEIVFDQGASDGVLELDYVRVDYEMPSQSILDLDLFPGVQKTGEYTISPEAGDGFRAYNISDTGNPSQLTGILLENGIAVFNCVVTDSTRLLMLLPGQWMQPDTIRSAFPGRLVGTVSSGDRLIVVPACLYDGIWGFASILESLGRIPVIATTREIYDEFGQGVADPGAIRSAIGWGIDSWAPGLLGTILAGDGHYDYLGRTTTQPVLIPPYIRLSGSNSGDCFDDFYVLAHEGAVLPEIPIARIPADNETELGTCTAKSIMYCSGAAYGTWMNRCMIVADDEWGQDNQMNETMHTTMCEQIAEEALPPHLDRSKFYLIEYPWPPGTPSGPHPIKPEAREDFVDALSEGLTSLVYLGHGSAGQIAHEEMLLSDDIELLTNGSRLPITIWATCAVGYFDSPGPDAIAEDLINHPAGGGIVSIANTQGCTAGGNYALSRAILDSLYSNPEITMSEALWLAKLNVPGSYISNNRSYILFGFPDFPLIDTGGEAILSVDDDTLYSGEGNTVSGSGFPSEGLAWVVLKESSVQTSYTCLSGSIIEYLRYGGSAFRGTVTVQAGQFQMECIIPIQADTGSYARAAATSLGNQEVSTGAVDPVSLITGSPSGDDFAGPDITMWIRGYEGVEHPMVTGEVVVEAELEDESGICFLGGEGRQLMLFVNGDGTDVGDRFWYNQGSSTTGRLSYDLSGLTAGDYVLILHAVDGVGNFSTDSLLIQTLDASEMAISESIVYPNPGSGSRCFSFRLSATAGVGISIYTISGRKIRTLSSFCEQGYNQIMWDGLDADGDPPSSGCYIYRIRAVSDGTSVFGSETDYTGMFAVVRE